MEAVVRRLRLLRGWFLALYVVQSVLAIGITIDVIGSLRRAGGVAGAELARVSDGHVLGWTLCALVGLLALVLWLFREVLRLRPWARLVLLVVAWVSAVSAAISVVAAPSAGTVAPWVARYADGLDVASLAPLSVLANALSLVLWGYVIWTLQFREDVRAAFCGPR